jgi:signal transduction histidine kinase
MDVPSSTPAPIPRIRGLAIGFVVALALLAVTVPLAAFSIARVQRSTMALARRSHESTYYLGDVGGQLALMRGYAALATRSSPAALADLEKRLDAADGGLQLSIEALPAVLDDGARGDWAALEPRIQDMRVMLLDAFELAKTGKVVDAAALMGDELATQTEVYDRLDRLEQRHRAATVVAFRAADRAVLRGRVLEALLGALLLAGTVVIWVAILRAFGRQRRQIAAHVRAIEALNLDLDAFAGRVAHDLRNALSPVVTAAAMLRRAADDPKAVAAVSDRIERSSARSIALVDGLLAFSRAAWTKSEVGETSSIRAAVDGAIEETQTLADRIGARIEVHCDDVRVQCPQGVLAVVMANLCSNAVKFLEGCRERVVRISTRRDEPWCVIAVEDTGPGIPAAALGRIYEPFFRVPGARATGSGIGLATVARIVDRCGGSIHVDSTIGFGTRFEVRLPLANAS